jgi:hypothetical protein
MTSVAKYVDIHGQSTEQDTEGYGTSSLVDWNVEVPHHAVGIYIIVFFRQTSPKRWGKFIQKRLA